MEDEKLEEEEVLPEDQDEDQDEDLEEDEGFEEEGDHPEEAGEQEPEEEEEPKQDNAAQIEAQAQKVADQKIAAMKLVNHYTGEPIRSQKDYDAYQDAQWNEKKERMKTRLGWDDEDYDNFIASDPRVRKAEAALEQAEKAKQTELMNAELRVIGGLNPAIKTVDDLLKDPSIDRVMHRCKTTGCTVSEAYKLENWDSIVSGANRKGAQAAYKSVQSRSHLRSTAQRGSGGIQVPEKVAQSYRRLFPGISDAEIAKHYKAQKGK